MTIREWINLWNGKRIDVDGAYGDQCWDLVAKYAKEMIGCPSLPTRPGGNGFAMDVFNNFLKPLPQYFDKIKNDPNNPNQVPLPGDIIVWGQNGLGGHIAIVMSAPPASSTLQVFQQNAPVGQPSLIGQASYNGVLGWLSPKKRPDFDAPAPAPVVPKTPEKPNDDFYTFQNGDTFWGLEEAWKLPHGTLQSLNPTLEPRKIPKGTQIRIRAAAAPKPADTKPGVVPETYKIRSGDTYWDLENHFGLRRGSLQELNPEYPARALPIGATIRLLPKPAPAPAATPAVATVEPPAPAAVPEPTAQVEQSASNAAPSAEAVPQPAPETPAPEPVPQAKPAQSFFAKHFNKEKVLKDLAAAGSLFSGVALFVTDHWQAIAFVLSTIAGIIFGENRFKVKK